MGPFLNRPKIVHAAWDVLLADGLDAVSLRRVARELDVTAPALYAHIDGKDDLLAAIGDLEFEELRSRTEPPENGTPMAAIEAVVAGYVSFALERPNAFQLLFQPHFDPASAPTLGVREAQTVELFERTVETVRQAVDAGTFRDVDARLTGFALWCMAHGIARGIQLGYQDHEPAEIVSQIVATFSEGLIRS